MPPYQRAISPHDNGNVEDDSNDDDVDDDVSHDSLYKIDTIINRNTECLRRNIADDAVGRRSSEDTARLDGPTKQVLSRCDYPAAVHENPGLATKREPPPEQRHRKNTNTSTMVTFAGRVMPYTHPKNNADQIVHLFWDAVQICEIPPRAEYTHAEQRAMWYTREELERMKQVSVETVQKTLQLLQFHQQQCNRRHPQTNISTTTATTLASKESLGYCRFFFLRGLEKVVDHYTTTSTRTTNNGRTTTSRTTSTTYQRRYDSIYAVLTEQYAQRMECLGQVGDRVMYDDQRLKHAYQSHHRTRTSLDEAHGLAHQDAILVVEQYATTNPYYKCDDPSDPDQYCDPHQYGYDPNKNEKTVSTTKKTWSPFLLFPLASLVVDKETRELLPVVHEMVLTVMQRMLPFLEVRSKENAVWDIDHNIEEQNVVTPAASCGTRSTYVM